MTHSFTWNALADLEASFNGTVLLRTQATDTQNATGNWSDPMPSVGGENWRWHSAE